VETVEVRRKLGRAQGHRPMSEDDVLVIKVGKGRGVKFRTPEGDVPVDPEHLRMVEDAVTLHKDPTAEPGPENPSVTVVEHVLAALFACGVEDAEIEVRGEPGYAEHVWRVDCRIDEVVSALDGPSDPPDPRNTDPAVGRFYVREGELPAVARNVEGRAEPAPVDHVLVEVSDEIIDPTDPKTIARGAVSNKTPEHAALDATADVFMLMRTSGLRLSLSRPTSATSVHPADVCLAAAVKPGVRVIALSSGGRFLGALAVNEGEEIAVRCSSEADVFTSETPSGPFSVRGAVFEPSEGRWTVGSDVILHVGDPLEPQGW